METNKLPENWCVLNDGSQLFKDTVVKYTNKKIPPVNGEILWEGNWRGYYYGINEEKRKCSIVAFGVLLSLEKFIALTAEKTIIGYKAPYDLFKGRIKKGDILKNTNGFNYRITENGYFAGTETTDLPREIVETWEPVYEEDQKKTIKLKSDSGEINIVVSKKEIVFKESGIHINAESAEALMGDLYRTRQLNLKLGGPFGVTINSVNIGCQHNIPFSQLVAVMEAYNELNK